MTSLGAKSRAEEITWEAIVIRCGCGAPDSHNSIAGPGGACPKPRKIEDLGVIAHYKRRRILAFFRRR